MRRFLRFFVAQVIALTMLQSTSAASAAEDDDFLLLLIPSIVAAKRVKLSATSAIPGQLLTITGRRFDPDAPTTVVFTDQAGRETRVIPRSTTTATTVEVSVPFFLNLDTFQVGPGTVFVSVVQERNGGEAVFRAFDALQIADLPQTGLPPGAVTLEFLTQLRNLIGIAAEDYLTIEEASSGTVDTSALRQNLLTMLDNLTTAQTQIQRLVNGEVSQIDIGDIGGQRVFLDRNSLALLDRMYVGYLFSPGFETLESIGAQIRRMITEQDPEQLRELSKKFRGAGGVMVAGAVIAGVTVLALGGTTVGAPIIALGAVGALAWSVGTWVPLAITAALEGPARQLSGGQISAEGFRSTIGISFDAISGRVTGSARGFFAGQFGRLGQLGNGLFEVVSGARELVTTVAPQVAGQITQNFDIIRDGLTAPEPEPEPEPPPPDTLTWVFSANYSADGSNFSCSGVTFTLPFAGGSASFTCDVATATATVNIPGLSFSVGGFGNVSFEGITCTGTGGGSSAITVTETGFFTVGTISGSGTCTDPVFGTFPFMVSGTYDASAAK